MKTFKMKIGAILLLSGAVVALSGCRDKTEQTRTYTANVPIYVDAEEVRGDVGSAPAKALSNTGKIFLKDSYLFINNREEGVHIIDNSNPSSPMNMGYINIPGNREITIDGSILYADSYIDLVAIDISDPNNCTEVGRLKNVFPLNLPETDPNYRIAKVDPEKGVVVGWKIETITETDDGSDWDPWFRPRPGVQLFEEPDGPAFGASDDFARNMSVGVSGSMGGFIVKDNYLYALAENAIKVFDLSNATNPSLVNTVETNREVETLYPFKDRLFVGTTTGMLTYKIDNPSNPEYVSAFDHVESCDPVVANDDYAYVTLRSGNNCGGWTNSLDIVDVSDLESPRQVGSKWMQNPHGLSLDGDRLFVCDGGAGLVVFDLSLNPQSPVETKRFQDIVAYDAITFNDVLMVVGNGGLNQYDVSDIGNVNLLSTLSTK